MSVVNDRERRTCTITHLEIHDKGRMDFLISLLDKLATQPFGICDVCSGNWCVVEFHNAIFAEAKRLHRRGCLVIDSPWKYFGREPADNLRVEPVFEVRG